MDAWAISVCALDLNFQDVLYTVRVKKNFPYRRV